MNEYDQIRNMLGKIRKHTLNENDLMLDKNLLDEPKQGEKITFDDINTVGFLTTTNIEDDGIKRGVSTAAGEFLKATGLIANSIDIHIEDGRVLITSQTIKNPELDNIKQIKFDTDAEYPEIELLGGDLKLTSGLVALLNDIVTAYEDLQIGRDALVSATQIKL